jgi:hypothetical protein
LFFFYFLELADSYIKISGGILQLANNDPGPLDKFLAKVSDTFERARVSCLKIKYQNKF